MMWSTLKSDDFNYIALGAVILSFRTVMIYFAKLYLPDGKLLIIKTVLSNARTDRASTCPKFASRILAYA